MSAPVSLRDFKFGTMPRKLGAGVNADVWEVTHSPSDTMLALKVISKNKITSPSGVAAVHTEKKCLQACSGCSFVAQLYFSFVDDCNFYMGMALAGAGDSLQFCSRFPHNRIPEDGLVFFGAQLCSALEHIHGCGIIHRDIKPANCLVKNNGYILLADFGLATTIDLEAGERNSAGSVVGTPEYISPEVLQRGPHTFAVDWWGVGVTLYDLLCGRIPFVEQKRSEMFKRIMFGSLQFNPSIVNSSSDNVIQLIALLMTKVPHRRLGSGGVDEVRQHPAFNCIDWNQLETQTLSPPNCIADAASEPLPSCETHREVGIPTEATNQPRLPVEQLSVETTESTSVTTSPSSQHDRPENNNEIVVVASSQIAATRPATTSCLTLNGSSGVAHIQHRTISVPPPSIPSYRANPAQTHQCRRECLQLLAAARAAVAVAAETETLQQEQESPADEL